MNSINKPCLFAESKKPGTGFTRTAKPNGNKKPSKPNPNYRPPASIKKP